MKFRKTEKMTLIVFACIFLLLMIIGSAFDLQISQNLADLPQNGYYSTNWFLRMTEIFGETVIYGLLSVAIISIFLASELIFEGQNKKIIIVKVVSALTVILVNAFGAYKVIGYFFDIYGSEIISETFKSVVVYGVFGIVFTLIWLSALSRIKPETLKTLCIWSLVIILTVAVSQGLTQLLKITLQRTRFRTLNVINDFSFYRVWFLPNGLTVYDKNSILATLGKDALRSFPSGHTVSATCLFTLTALPCLFEKMRTQKTRIILFSVALAYSLLIFVSRILIGAHYLSDVTFAFFLTLCVYYFSRKFIFSKFNVSDELTFEPLSISSEFSATRKRRKR